MYTVKTYNKISEKGLNLLINDSVTLDTESENPDVILLRSQKLHDHTFNDNLKAVGRAGAGVNNIPVEKLTEKGVVVFNTPGANANAVKELVIAGMLLGSRNIFNGMTYVNSLRGTDADIHSEVEKKKSEFKGVELQGKTLGVIGLGAIGVLVANAAVSLGLKVYGYDPYIAVDRAWGLSSAVKQARNLKKMLSEVDFLTFHMPLMDKTVGFYDKEKIEATKEGAIVLNFARPEIVNETDILESLESNRIKKYVTDFPNNELLVSDKVIGLPHLGASTQEAEDNCAIMIANQVKDFLDNGNIVNSVNFPSCVLERVGGHRISILNKNVPNMVGQITAEIAKCSLNIIEMVNKSRGDIAYTLVEMSEKPDETLINNISAIEGVLFVREIPGADS